MVSCWKSLGSSARELLLPGLGFVVRSFGVSGLQFHGFMIQNLGCRRNEQQNTENGKNWLRVQGSRIKLHGSVQGAGFRAQGSGCRVQGAGCRVQDAGSMVQAHRKKQSGEILV
jgi:hypothetical protein